MTDISLREAIEADVPSIEALSSILAEQAQFAWHQADVIQKFQDDYIIEMMASATEPHITLIAEKGEQFLGFVHARETIDELSGEKRCTIPLLAVEKEAQGNGVGKQLIGAVEMWSRKQGYRLMHLEVFATNAHARNFYENIAFQEETIHMIKALE